MVQILTTKLFIPATREELVSRPRLIARLNEALSARRRPNVTLISAPAGFGKTTLLSEWMSSSGRPASWLSLDEGDNDPARFLTYLIVALQTVKTNLGAKVLGMLQSPQPPSTDSILTSLLNEIAAVDEDFIVVLDDYHVVESKAVDQALAFLLEHLPPQMHLVIATREDPALPLARLRARGQLTELRAADLRFTLEEAAEFLNQVMGLRLSTENIAALETRTEGWIAGLQLAALSMQGQQDAERFIQSFSGSHHFVMDYLVEEVLKQQPENVQTFLLYTSILDRMCGPLCDAVLQTNKKNSSETLEDLERANLFIIPLDHERRWYRYHHLFADLLRQRLYQRFQAMGDAETRIHELHIRASQWYEENNLHIEAFHHAAAANDIDRVEKLIGGDRIPQHFRGAVTAILNWLGSLPQSVLDARPWLQWRYASLLLVNGHTTGVDEKLQAAEAALGDADSEFNRNLIGQIAAARSVVALTRYQVESMLAQSRRALEFLHPNSLIPRATAHWTMGYAYLLQGDRNAARRALTDGIAISRAAGDVFTMMLSMLGLGNIQEADNQLHHAEETYRRVLEMAGDQPLQIVHEAHLGMARLLYEWNDLDAAQQYGEQSLLLARQYDTVIDRFVICEVLLARLKLAQGDVSGAAALLGKTEQAVRQKNFLQRMPEVAAVQVQTLLRQGNLSVAAHLAQTYKLPLSQVRVLLAQGESTAALSILEAYRHEMEARNWQDERLRTLVLQALAYHAQGETDQALQMLREALSLAEPGGYIRLFVDEGPSMANLLSEAAAQGIMPDYVEKVVTAFGTRADQPASLTPPPLIEPLSTRELEVLRLIAQGLSNQEISQQLFLALDTVKGHNRRIFDKLQVQRRTEAVARARELGLL